VEFELFLASSSDWERDTAMIDIEAIRFTRELPPKNAAVIQVTGEFSR
jgi:hypothetical protein